MTTDLLHIDGSQGEGGGQIVRSSLALSVVTGKAVTIERLRAGREKPGLMRQHLTAVLAAAEICGGKVDGAEIGSKQLRFEPGPVKPGNYKFSIGTAGSATLVLQTVLPALLCADAPSELVLEGGTHNQWAPPLDFLQRAYLPLVNRLGPRVTAQLKRHGFYPAGGGRFTVSVEPARRLAGFDLLQRGPIHSRSVVALVANLPEHIADREIAHIQEKMNWDPSTGRAEQVAAHGPGNVVFAEIACEHVTEIFTGFGRTGARAEQVADEVVQEIRGYLSTDAPVGTHLADQLLLPLALSAGQPCDQQGPEVQRGGSFRTLPLTRHSTTHIEIIRRFLDVEIGVERAADGLTCEVTVRGRAE